MPIILVIVGVIAALGLGGYFWETSRHDTAVPTPTPVTTEATPTKTEPTPVPPTPVPTPTPTPVAAEPTPVTPTPVTTPKPTPTPVTTPKPTPTPVPKTAFKDGTYTASVTYPAPDRGTHPVTVKLTLKNDIVTASDVTFGSEAQGATANYEDRFAAAYKSLVVGQSLASISLTRVGGASLTTNAWNDAQAKITAQAKS